MFYWWDPTYLLFIAPAVLLALWAQFRVQSAYAAAGQVPAPLSGAGAARHILDSAGLTGVPIDIVPGHLTDHYDPRDRVLRLSEEVFHGRSLAAVGIAAHEAGHALQHAWVYGPLVVRNLAVPIASFGSNASILMLIFGAILNQAWLFLAGIIAFSGVVLFQVVNLPVEFNASARAKAQLAQLGIVNSDEMRYVSAVLSAAALTYVAATLQAILTLLYYVMRFSRMGGSRD